MYMLFFNFDKEIIGVRQYSHIHETSNIIDDTVSTQKAWTIRKVMGGGGGRSTRQKIHARQTSYTASSPEKFLHMENIFLQGKC